MILDDLFEQKPLPAHIKPSDIPPAMRNRRLTMRDIEAERPKGAYRYRVTTGIAGESPKDFTSLAGAQEYAQAVRGRVQPLEEQAADPDVQRGMVNLKNIEDNVTNDNTVLIQNETDHPDYQIEEANDKKWLLSHAKEWIDAGKASDLYRYMGTNAGFEFLLNAWQKEDMIRQQRARAPQAPEEPELFAPGQAGGPRAPRMQQRESAVSQKKRADLAEEPKGASGRTERMLSQMRARQPQAASDLEALAYELQDAERRDAQEIDKLEREVDNLESDVKSELQKRIATLTKRKGGIQQAAVSDVKTDAVLDQLARVNDQQQREINDLTRAVASLAPAAAPSKSLPAVSAEPRRAAPASRVDTTPTAAITDLKKVTAAPPSSEITPSSSATTPDVSTDIEPDSIATRSPSNVLPFSQKFKRASAEPKQKAAEGVGDWLKREKSQAKSFAGTLGRAVINRPYVPADPASRAQRGQGQWTGKPAPSSVGGDWATIAAKSAANVAQAEKELALLKKATMSLQGGTALTPTELKTVNDFRVGQGEPPIPSGWKIGDPITISGQTITARHPKYQEIARAMVKQQIAEKDRSPGKITKSEDPCWSGYHMVGTKTKGGRTVPNCVPGAKGAANESLRDIAEQAALTKLRTRDHPAFQMFMESWYRAHGGT